LPPALSPDSEASRRYLRELRERLDLPEDTIDDLHRDLHMPR